MFMYDNKQHVLHLRIFLGVQSYQGQILFRFGYSAFDQDLVNVVSVEGENERSLITLRGLHARRRTYTWRLIIKGPDLVLRPRRLGLRTTTGPWKSGMISRFCTENELNRDFLKVGFWTRRY